MIKFIKPWLIAALALLPFGAQAQQVLSPGDYRVPQPTVVIDTVDVADGCYRVQSGAYATIVCPVSPPPDTTPTPPIALLPGPSGTPAFTAVTGGVRASWSAGVRATSYRTTGNGISASTASATSRVLPTTFAGWFCAQSMNSVGSAEQACNTYVPPVTPPPGGGGTPGTPGANEPAGFARITSRACDARVEDGWAEPMGTLDIVADGSRTVCRTTYPAGMRDGSAPVNMWRTLAGTDEVYFRFDVKVSSNWEDHPVADKIGYSSDFSFGSGAGQPMVFTLTRGVVTIHSQGPLGSVNYYGGASASDGNPNQATGRFEIPRGQWATVEILMASHASAGTIDAWVNGVKTHQYRNVAWSNSSPSWDDFKWQPVWGGNMGIFVRTTMYQYIDNIYISGR